MFSAQHIGFKNLTFKLIVTFIFIIRIESIIIIGVASICITVKKIFI